MDKIKVSLFVKGNIISESVVSWAKKDYLRAKVTPEMIEERYDISDAFVIDGDMRVDALNCRDKAVIATGYITVKARE